MKPFDLIQISNHSPRRRGTFECYTRALAEAVRDAGGTAHLVYFAEPEEWFSNWMAEAGATTYGLPYDLTEPEQPWRIAREVRRLRRPGPRTVVHVQFPILNWICPALRTMGFRNVILSDQLSGVCRNLPWYLRKAKNLANRLQVSGASKITALSSHIMRRQVSAGIPEDRTQILHIGCDLDEYAPPSADRKSGLRLEHGFVDSDVIVCFTGRLMKEKGVDTLLKAIAMARESAPEMRALIVGQGDAREELEGMAEELEIAEVVRFTGHVPSVVPYLQLSDIFVCPSVWEEGFGYVNIEAMAVGLPVIASRAGGIVDTVQDAKTGFLVTPGDSSELAEKILALCEDAGRGQAMGRAGMERARQCFSLETTVEQTMQLYASML